jgi:hypothetical protein
MSSEPSSFNSNFFYYFYFFLVFIIILRFVRSIYGTRVSVTGFVRVSIVYIVIATLALFGSYAIGVSPIYFLVDPVIAVASGFLHSA